jgi:hypothetical protein
MNNFKVLGKLPVKPLIKALAERDDLWNKHLDRQMGADMVSPGTKFDDIWVHMAQSVNEMSPDQKHEMMTKGPWINPANFWRQAYYELPIKDILMQAFHFLDGQAYGRVFMSRMKPGAKIFPHIDQDILHFARTHVALSEDKDQIFKCGDEVFSPKLGEIFWFDNSLLHSVENNSEIDRLTLVIDMQTPWHGYFKARSFNKD